MSVKALLPQNGTLVVLANSSLIIAHKDFTEDLNATNEVQMQMVENIK